ncbi:hypothetical protein KKF55_00655 [Patescibacteria group bacterium]|nr:hypothetical protein [Patescibacteria group bacterium]
MEQSAGTAPRTTDEIVEGWFAIVNQHEASTAASRAKLPLEIRLKTEEALAEWRRGTHEHAALLYRANADFLKIDQVILKKVEAAHHPNPIP